MVMVISRRKYMDHKNIGYYYRHDTYLLVDWKLAIVVVNSACPATDCARGVPITRIILCIWSRRRAILCTGASAGAPVAGGPVCWCCECAVDAAASADRLLKIKPVVSAGAATATPAAAASVGEYAAACLRVCVRVWACPRSLALGCCGRRGADRRS